MTGKNQHLFDLLTNGLVELEFFEQAVCTSPDGCDEAGTILAVVSLDDDQTAIACWCPGHAALMKPFLEFATGIAEGGDDDGPDK